MFLIKLIIRIVQIHFLLKNLKTETPKPLEEIQCSNVG
jgi:hypothetical protein